MTHRHSEAVLAGSEFLITTIALGELFYGAYNSARVEQNVERLREIILPNMIVYDFDVVAAEEFGKIQAELRAEGRPIPTADAQIAAIARAHGLTLLTSDSHFSLVNNLSIEDWLAA